MKPRLRLMGPWRPNKWECVSTEDSAYGPFICVGRGYSAREAFGKWQRATLAWQRAHGFRHPSRST